MSGLLGCSSTRTHDAADNLVCALVLPVDPAIHDRHLVLCQSSSLVACNTCRTTKSFNDVGLLNKHTDFFHAFGRQRQRRCDSSRQTLGDVGDKHNNKTIDKCISKFHLSDHAGAEEDDRHCDCNDSNDLDEHVDVALKSGFTLSGLCSQRVDLSNERVITTPDNDTITFSVQNLKEWVTVSGRAFEATAAIARSSR